MMKQCILPAISLRILFILFQNEKIHSSSSLSPIFDPSHSWNDILSSSQWMKQLIVLAADLIGALCIYHVGVAILEYEKEESELLEQGDELLIPWVLRPERGWIFGLPSKQVVADAQADANKKQTKKRPIMSLQQLPLIPSTLYLINPISIFAAGHSLRSIWDMFLLTSFYYATSKKKGVNQPTGAKCAFFLALATYADVAYIVFLVPVLLWRGLLRDVSVDMGGCHSDWKIVLILFAAYYSGLQLLTVYAMEGNAIDRLLPNVAFVELDESGSFTGPNIGLHWYFVVQMFDRFRPYFSAFVGALPSVFIIPLTIRLHRYPSVLAAAFQLLWSIFRPVATVHTLTLGLTFILLSPRSIIRMRDSSLIAFFALPVPISLFVTFHRMWLLTGNGNPNYLFFQCFAYGLFVAVILLDVVSATVKRDKVRRMAEKGEFSKKVNTEQQEEAAHKAVPEENSAADASSSARDANSNHDMAKKQRKNPVVVFL